MTHFPPGPRSWETIEDYLDGPCGSQLVPGQKVRFTGASQTQINWGSGNDDPNKILILGKTYTIEAIKVHSWHTKVRILGFDGAFNSVSFKPV